MRRTVTFTVPVATPLGPRYLSADPEGGLVGPEQAASFQLYAAPTGIQRLTIRDLTYEIAGAAVGDVKGGLRQVAALQGRLDAIDRTIAATASKAVRGDRAPQDVGSQELEAWYSRPESDWDNARRGLVGLEQERSQIAEVLDEIEFQARFEVLALDVPGAYRRLREVALEPVRAQALQSAYFNACAALQEASGKAPPSGS